MGSFDASRPCGSNAGKFIEFERLIGIWIDEAHSTARPLWASTSNKHHVCVDSDTPKKQLVSSSLFCLEAAVEFGLGLDLIAIVIVVIHVYGLRRSKEASEGFEKGSGGHGETDTGEQEFGGARVKDAMLAGQTKGHKCKFTTLTEKKARLLGRGPGFTKGQTNARANHRLD
eukprot:scaffold1278_cov50-Attheya_sp.AAC.2